MQRPDAIARAPLDIFILRTLAGFLKTRLRTRSDLVGIADQFGQQLFEELNYHQEAENCRRFKECYGAVPNIVVSDGDVLSLVIVSVEGCRVTAPCLI